MYHLIEMKKKMKLRSNALIDIKTPYDIQNSYICLWFQSEIGKFKC